MNFRTLDLNLLRVFDMLMSEGSLTRAAAALSMTQPAASHALKRLHSAVGDKLFVRSAQGMTPTARAEALWPQVRAALAALQQALAPQSFDPASEERSFRIATADAAAAAIAPSMMAAIESQRALASIRMLPLTTGDPRQLLLQDEVDLAVGHFPFAPSEIRPEGAPGLPGRLGQLRHQRLHVSPYVCVMRRVHPLAQAPLTLETYCEAPHLLVSLSGLALGPADEVLSSLGRSRRIVLSVNQYFTAGRVIRASNLLTLLPASFVEATGTPEDFVTQAPPFALAPMTVDMVWAARRDSEPALRWLRTLVEQAAGPLPAG